MSEIADCYVSIPEEDSLSDFRSTRGASDSSANLLGSEKAPKRFTSMFGMRRKQASLRSMMTGQYGSIQHDVDEDEVLANDEVSTCDRITFAFHYKRMIAVLPDEDVRERLINEWMTVSVISSFVATFAFTNIGTGVPAVMSARGNDWWAVTTYTTCTITSYCMATCSLLLCVVFFMALNVIPVHRTRAFVRTMVNVLPAPAATMLLAFAAIHVVVSVVAIAEFSVIATAVALSQAAVLLVFGCGCTLWLFWKVKVALSSLHKAQKSRLQSKKVASLQTVLKSAGLNPMEIEAGCGSFEQSDVSMKLLRQLLSVGSGASKLLQNVLDEVLPELSAVKRAKVMLAIRKAA